MTSQAALRIQLHPPYPEILTQRDWDRRKGAFAKLHGRTGVGAAMLKCERLYANVNWRVVNPSEAGVRLTQLTPADWDRVRTAALAEVHGRVRELARALEELIRLADATHRSFQASRTIPSSSTEHVRNIGVVARRLYVALEMRRFEQVYER